MKMKKQLRKYKKEGNKVICESLRDEEKEYIRKNDKKRKTDKRLQTLDGRSRIFGNVQMSSMSDSGILTKLAFRLIEEDFKSATHERPTYICDTVWKFDFPRNVIKLKESMYQ